MGGHTIYPGGIVLDMLPFDHMKLDARARVLRVGAGARWSKVIPFLDSQGLSVSVMQSNDNFSVGGSLSVNCHGWQHEHQPIASSVESFRLMQADGTVVRCSRTENAELFSLVLGGYGLFGVILDAELRVVPNERYRPETEVIPSEFYVRRFR
jgi:FAD/FMN-containing dehydrogenase